MTDSPYSPESDLDVEALLGPPEVVTFSKLAFVMDHAVNTLAEVEALHASQGRKPTSAERAMFASQFLFSYISITFFPEIHGGSFDHLALAVVPVVSSDDEPPA